MSTIVNAKFKITNTKLYVPIVILSSKDNTKLIKLFGKLLKDGCNRPVYWSEYQNKNRNKKLRQ